MENFHSQAMMQLIITRVNIKKNIYGKFHKINYHQNKNLIFFSDAFVETSQSFSTVIFHSNAGQRPKSSFDRSFSPEIKPLSRKTSLSNEMMRGNNGDADENDNLDFIQEEIAPGRKSIFKGIL